MQTRETLENRTDADQSIDRNKRYAQIRSILGRFPEGMTAREVTTEMLSEGHIRSFDMNYVRPRLTEMAYHRQVLEVGKRKDMVTGKNNTVYRLREE